jgi:hypothetical protein
VDDSQRITVPSGRQLDLVRRPTIRESITKYNVYWMGVTWIRAVSDRDTVLRMVDRPALRLLERDGAKNATELAEALGKKGTFKSKGLGTNVTSDVMGAWLEFADRRRLVEPYPGDAHRPGPTRWNATAHGRDTAKGASLLSAIPKAIGPISGLFGIVVALVGGAAVVNEVVQENFDVLVAVVLALLLLVVYFGGLWLLGSLFDRRIRRITLASLQLTQAHGGLMLPEPRVTGPSTPTPSVTVNVPADQSG